MGLVKIDLSLPNGISQGIKLQFVMGMKKNTATKYFLVLCRYLIIVKKKQIKQVEYKQVN